MEDAKGAKGPFRGWWQPPERFRLAKVANEPFWCPIKKKPLFSMAQFLNPWIPNAKEWLDPWILNTKGAKGAKGPKGRRILYSLKCT